MSIQVADVARLVDTADGKAILEVAGRAVFELNRVAVSIWNKLAARLSIQEIVSQIALEFKAPEDRVAKDVAQFIELLKDRLLVYDDN
jgi:Coenzyme PQQ synthesis protein D (PqqD)